MELDPRHVQSSNGRFHALRWSPHTVILWSVEGKGKIVSDPRMVWDRSSMDSVVRTATYEPSLDPVPVSVSSAIGGLLDARAQRGGVAFLSQGDDLLEVSDELGTVIRYTITGAACSDATIMFEGDLHDPDSAAPAPSAGRASVRPADAFFPE